MGARRIAQTNSTSGNEDEHELNLRLVLVLCPGWSPPIFRQQVWLRAFSQ